METLIFSRVFYKEFYIAKEPSSGCDISDDGSFVVVWSVYD